MNFIAFVALYLMNHALRIDIPSIHSKVLTSDLHHALHRALQSHTLLHVTDPQMTIVVCLTGHPCDPMNAHLFNGTELRFPNTPSM